LADRALHVGHGRLLARALADRAHRAGLRARRDPARRGVPRRGAPAALVGPQGGHRHRAAPDAAVPLLEHLPRAVVRLRGDRPADPPLVGTAVDLLRNTVQPYAWGSPTAIPQLLGVDNPEGTAQAELWMGAHPTAPSKLTRAAREISLDQVIAAAPELELGEATAERFNGRLPFLLKVLAARKALSIQLHPDRAQAEAGFAAEEARGVPRDARERVYVDDWPKPEVLCALTPFEVLAGLRPAAQAAAILSRLGVGALETVAAELRANPKPATVARALATLLSWPTAERAALVSEVVAAAARLAAEPSEFQAAYDAVGRVAQDHPGDI